MDEPEFDELLRSSAPTPSRAAGATALLLVDDIRGANAAPAPPHATRRHRRRRTVLIAAAAAAVALSAGGTIAAYQLSIPPFQTLEKGVDRAHTGIPVTYTNSLGRTVKCQAFIEYRNLDNAQQAAIERISSSKRWEGYGQRVLDELRIPKASPQAQNQAINEAALDDLWQAAHEAVPPMVFMQPSSGPVFNGFAMSCAEPGGVDGQP
jgi:hypothetical protein